MPITVEVIDHRVIPEQIDRVFGYFHSVDELFSTYKPTSEISRLNAGTLKRDESHHKVQTVLRLAEETKSLTGGYFDVYRHGHLDPSGLVKGWAIEQATKLLQHEGLQNYYIAAGGDIAAAGQNSQGQAWRVGIRHPFHKDEVVKVVAIGDAGVATSGTYERGEHIYNPRHGYGAANEIASLTVIGPNIYEADRFATAAFAMGQKGIHFIERRPGLEGYMIDLDGTATMTTGFDQYLAS